MFRLRTNRKIRAIRFSPDSKHFALTKEDCAFVYRSPGADTRDYSPFVMERVLKVIVASSVVDPNTLNLDPDPGFWPNLDPDPGLYCTINFKRKNSNNFREE